jgi:hypothetical protein
VNTGLNFIPGSNILPHIRPVLRKKLIHKGKNVQLNFRSLMLQLIKIRNIDDFGDQRTRSLESMKLSSPRKEKPKEKIHKYKFLNPIYVPVDRLDAYMNLEVSQMEMHLLKSIY